MSTKGAWTVKKLDDKQVSELRRLAAEGHSLPDLAMKFGISRRHAARLAAGESQPEAGLRSNSAGPGAVEAALAAFLADQQLEHARPTVAANALVLARRLDGCASATSAASATAAASLTRELQGLLQVLAPNDDALTAADQLDRLLAPLRRYAG